MLLRPERLRFDTSLPPDAIVEALQAVGREWRESTLSPIARAAGIFAWNVRKRGDRIVVRALIMGQNPFLPFFVGTVQRTATGSVIVGELRLHWLSRGAMLVWLTLVALAPVLPFFEPPYDSGLGDHIFAAAFMLLPAIALFAAGRWMLRHWSAAPAAATSQLLSRIAAQRAPNLTSSILSPDP